MVVDRFHVRAFGRLATGAVPKLQGSADTALGRADSYAPEPLFLVVQEILARLVDAAGGDDVVPEGRGTWCPRPGR